MIGFITVKGRTTNGPIVINVNAISAYLPCFNYTDPTTEILLNNGVAYVVSESMSEVQDKINSVIRNMSRAFGNNTTFANDYYSG